MLSKVVYEETLNTDYLPSEIHIHITTCKEEIQDILATDGQKGLERFIGVAAVETLRIRKLLDK